MHSAERKEGSSLKHLVKKAQQGDARAFVRLIEINKQSMYKIARSYFTNDEDIADAIQDTIETCYRSIRHLADPGYFRTWMTRILINKCIDIIRKKQKRASGKRISFVSARLTENGNYLTYALNVDPSEKEAHEIRVTPGYVPEGYVYQTDGPYESKWYNEKTEGSMTIIPYNAAELYLESRTSDSALQVAINKDSYIKTIEIQGMNVDIFTQENTDYIDSDDTQQDLYLFNEEWGYAVHVSLDRTDLAADEAEKIAEGLEIEVLESTVPYPTEEEIAELNREHEEANEEAAASTIVSGDRIRGINDTLSIDGNEDGSLKPHERFTGDNDRMTESTDAAFIIVKTKLRNTGDTAIDTYLSPLLRYLDENGNGDYTLLDPGEEEECVSVYVIDKDRLDSAYMEYFDTGAAAADTPELYVKVKE